MNEGLRGDGAGEDVDGDCPLPMRRALVMTMATDSPLRSLERTPDQPSRERLGLGGGSVS